MSGEAADFNGFLNPRTALSKQQSQAHSSAPKSKGSLRHATGVEVEIGPKPASTSGFPSAFAASFGDVISIGDLLRLADRRGPSLLDVRREDGETLRSEGAVINVHIEYSNEAKFDPLGQ